MNHDEAISTFTKQYTKELTSSQTTKDLVKKLRQKFFEQHNLSAASHFTNKEVAERLVEIIARAKKELPSDKLMDSLNSIPFIIDELNQSSILRLIKITQLSVQSNLTPDDLKKLRQEEYLRQLETQFAEKAAKEADVKVEKERKELQELKESLEKEKKFFETIKSELDALPATVDIDSLISISREILPAKVGVWWKDIGLEGDPFGSNQGLIGIPKSKYDDVVVRTPFIDMYLKMIENEPLQLLGKNIVVLGEFGSGKSTLFDIIAYRAGKIKILPMLTQINPDQSVVKLTNQLISQITDNLINAFPSASASGNFGSITMDEIGSSVHIMQAAMKSLNLKGFLLLVDGLHKTEIYQKQSLEFLQQLQNLQERLAHSDIPCGIIVAGSLAWEIEFSKNPSLSGSFYRIEKVPTLTEENAIEAVVRRINSYVHTGGSRPFIVKERLRETFSVLSKRLPRLPTFRDYLDHVRNRLVSFQFEDVGISIALHIETIELVKSEIEKSPLKEAYLNLASSYSHTPDFRAALKSILPEIYESTEIEESDPIFKFNKGAFFALRKEGFIKQRYHSTSKNVSWCLSEKVIEFLQNIHNMHKIMPKDALEALFTDINVVAPQEAYSIYSDVRKQMASMAASWRSSWPEVSELVEKTEREVGKIEKAIEDSNKIVSNEALESFIMSLRNLMKAIMFVTGDREALVDFDSKRFIESWYAPDDAEAIIRLSDRSKPLPHSSSEIFGLLNQHSQALSTLCTLLSDLIRGEGVMKLSECKLTSKESFKMHEARTLFLNQQYSDAVDSASEVIDLKIKDMVYCELRFVRGNKLTTLLPKDIQEKLKLPPRGHVMIKRFHDDNFFYHLSRSEYSKVIFQKEIRRIVLDNSLSESDLENIKSATELLFSLEDREAHKDRPTYFRNNATQIANVLKIVPSICESLNRAIEHMLIDDSFIFKKIDNNSLEFNFCVDNQMFENHNLSGPEVETLVYLVLKIADSDSISIPPIEPLSINSQTLPENIYGILRACVIQGFLSTTKKKGEFGWNFSITEKGKDRLINLRKIHEDAL